MKKISVLSLCLLFVSGLSLYAQEITGFWEIEKVTVGTKMMTPVARWTKIHADQTFESGNGWMQHSSGTWTYDQSQHLFKPVDRLGLKDEFGAFAVSFEDKTMIWKREEEGMPVTVKLKRVTEMPRSPADQVQGMWDLSTITKDGKDITASFDPNNKHYIFIRWDRVFNARNPEGNRESGYWHMHGHRAHMTLLPHQQGQHAETWEVDATDKTLRLKGISESNTGIERVYLRRQEFPK